MFLLSAVTVEEEKERAKLECCLLVVDGFPELRPWQEPHQGLPAPASSGAACAPKGQIIDLG